MAHKRVTMQNIADACGLSRNTVSKIFNERGAVPEATRKLVLQKAQQLGYLQIPPEQAGAADAPPPAQTPPQTQARTIALMTMSMPTDYHFGILLLPVFTERLSREGYTLMMYEISPEDLAARRLPPHMVRENTAGILTMELFNRDYMDMLCVQGIPILSVDGSICTITTPIKCDYILMENTASVITLMDSLIASGASRFGFVGDYVHCRSFQERWMGFRIALEKAGLPVEKEFCILDNDSEPYEDVDWMASRIHKLPVVPDAFVCANDYLALRVILALRQLGYSVPDDVQVIGFDDSPQSAVVVPSVTTVRIPNTDFGRIAADMLLDRIAHPDRPYRCTYIRTTPIWRDSTRRSAQSRLP